MDPQPISPQSPLPTEVHGEAGTKEGQSPRFPLFLTLLALLLLLSTIFLAYQNMQLQKQISELSKPTPIPSPTPTPNPTATLKTYTNSDYEFSFTYPKELIYLYDQLKGGNLLLQNFDGSKPRQETSEDFQFVLSVSKDDGTTLAQLAKNAGSKSTANFNIGGVTAIKGTSVQKYVDVPSVWFKMNGNLFTIQLSHPNSINKQWFDQILSTFKFLDTNHDTSEAKNACITLQSTEKYWDDIHLECREGGATKEEFQAFCTRYNGKFVDNADTCRYAQEMGQPCGPQLTYYCSFK